MGRGVADHLSPISHREYQNKKYAREDCIGPFRIRMSLLNMVCFQGIIDVSFRDSSYMYRCHRQSVER